MKAGMRTGALAALVAAVALAASAPAQARTCPNGRNSDGPMWLSILHAGLGEWALNGWGRFDQNAPPRKFWLGFIPGFGWPYLSVVSAIDVANCRTDDGLGLN